MGKKKVSCIFVPPPLAPDPGDATAVNSPDCQLNGLPQHAVAIIRYIMLIALQGTE